MESISTKDDLILTEGNTAENRTNKAINFLEAFSLIFGMIIGSGIFIGVGPTFDVFTSDSIGMVIVFWIIGGIMGMMGGLCYAELGSRIPESGGERAYYLIGLNKKFSITYIYIYIFIIKSITLAALSITTGSYLAGIFFNDEYHLKIFTKIFAATTLLTCFIVNCWSKKRANKAGIVFTVLKFLALIILIGIGIYSFAKEKPLEWERPFSFQGFSIMKLTMCLINLVWSYEGWNILGMVAGDMKNPIRDLPLAVFTSILMVMIFYIMCAVSYSATLGYSVVRHSETVGLSVARKVLKTGYFLIPLLICCSTFGATNCTFYATGSVIASAGYNGDLPLIFSLVHRSSRTPIIGLTVELLISMIFITFQFQVLLNYSAFVSWMIYLASFCCLMKLKIWPHKEYSTKIFQIPIVFVIIMKLVCLFTIIMCFYLKPLGCGLFALFIILVFGFQFVPDNYTSCSFLENIHEKMVKFLGDKCNLVPITSNDIS